MKFGLWLFYSFLLIMALYISCKRNNKTPEDDFFYYPAKNVYYDSKKAVYYYSLDSARAWDSMVYKGYDYGLVLGAKIPVKRPSTNAWLQNDSHRKEYNGTVLNIVNNRTIPVGKIDSINKIKPKRVLKPRPAEVIEEVKEEQPPKKGLKKFFNKIFGKKKKKDSTGN